MSKRNQCSTMSAEVKEKKIDFADIVKVRNGIDLVAGTLELVAIEANLINTMSREFIHKYADYQCFDRLQHMCWPKKDPIFIKNPTGK